MFCNLQLFLTISTLANYFKKKRLDQNDRLQDEGIEHGDSRILWIIIILPLAFNGSSSSWVFSFVDFRGVESDMWMYPKARSPVRRIRVESED